MDVSFALSLSLPLSLKSTNMSSDEDLKKSSHHIIPSLSDTWIRFTSGTAYVENATHTLDEAGDTVHLF